MFHVDRENSFHVCSFKQRRFYSPYDTRPTAIRHNRNIMRRSKLEKIENFVLSCGVGNNVGRVFEATFKASNYISKALSVTVAYSNDRTNCKSIVFCGNITYPMKRKCKCPEDVEGDLVVSFLVF